jgi:hypothetical protein
MTSMVAEDFLALHPVGPAYTDAAKRKEHMHWKLMAMREIVLDCEDMATLTRPIVPSQSNAMLQGNDSDIE